MIARKHGIKIESVTGTGPGRMIIREDIEKFINDKDKDQNILDLCCGRNIKETRPFNKIKKRIAGHMVRSLSIAAQVTLMGEIDMMEMKKVHQNLFTQERITCNKITYTDFFIYLVSKQLTKHPFINSSIIEDEIKL